MWKSCLRSFANLAPGSQHLKCPQKRLRTNSGAIIHVLAKQTHLFRNTDQSKKAVLNVEIVSDSFSRQPGRTWITNNGIKHLCLDDEQQAGKMKPIYRKVTIFHMSIVLWDWRCLTHFKTCLKWSNNYFKITNRNYNMGTSFETTRVEMYWDVILILRNVLEMSFSS